MKWHDPISGVSVLWTPEFTSEFLAAEVRCSHPRQQQCVQTAVDQSKRVRNQCLDCGSLLGPAQRRPPNFDSLPPENAALKSSRDRKVAETRSAIAIRHSDIQTRKDSDWWQRYNQYLTTDAWRGRREKVFKRCDGVCEGCGDAKADEVHHRTYDHVFDEFLFELVALCKSCHDRIHATDHDDGLPCLSCRMQSEVEGAAWCAKFDLSSLEALGERGPCGPAASALEPLK
jgi:5-methylcytosine-specific restriction endonuclease McrA